MEKNREFNMDEKLLEYYNKFYGQPEIVDLLYQLDMSIPYKSLKFYPVPVQFYTFFYVLVECLLLPKHKVANAKVIQMKYFNYLFYVNEELGINNLPYVVLLKDLLLLCLRKQETFKTPKGKEINTIDFLCIDDNNWGIKIENEIYDADDFEEIKKIICKQNDVELPDLTMHPDLEKKYEEYKELERKRSKVKAGNFEDMMLCLMAKTAYKKEDLKQLSIRTFAKLLERVDYVLNYELTTILAPNLDEKSRKNIKPWNSAIPKKNKLEEMATPLGEIENKINGVPNK